MKILSLILALFVTSTVSLLAADAGAAKAKPAKGKLYHVVSFKFKESASKEQIKEVEDAFKALKGKIKAIKTLEWGTNVSPEKHDKGFTHCWVLTFKTAADRDVYLVHPDHQAFGSIVGPVLDDVLVLDFWAKK